VTRREFTSFLTVISGVFFFFTSLIGLRGGWQRRPPNRHASVRIAQVIEVPIGGVKFFRYPTADDPCLLLRLSESHFVAYSQKCTHLLCPVVYRAADQQFHCPCHEGRFAVTDGRPLAGPPNRPLPRITLTRTEDSIWAIGVEL
jgi:nitrite reductase/ring-hydroxylating ferredoxin subunit